MRGLLAPLNGPVFRSLWLASVASNIGSLMHGVGVAWLMTSLTASPLLVSMVPVATLSPVLVLGVFGGVFADMFNRRNWLLVTQGWMMVCALAMGILAVSGFVNPAVLLGLAFAMGVGMALNLPVWQSLMQDIVPAEHIASAVSLNSISFNTGRILGPVLGGVFVAAAGAAMVFFVNAGSFLATVGVLAFWREARKPRECQRVMDSLKAGLVYLSRSPHLAPPLVRVAVFAFLSSGVVALLPLYAREEMGLGAGGFGLLLGSYGVGSLVAGTMIPALRRRIPPSLIVAAAMGLSATGLGILGFVREPVMVSSALFACGFSWVASLVNLNVSVQTSVPGGLRGRMLSIYFTSFQLAFALGALFAGSFAKAVGMSAYFWVASAAGLIFAPISARFALPQGVRHNSLSMRERHRD
jgi:MFS family permease